MKESHALLRARATVLPLFGKGTLNLYFAENTCMQTGKDCTLTGRIAANGNEYKCARLPPYANMFFTGDASFSLDGPLFVAPAGYLKHRCYMVGGERTQYWHAFVHDAFMKSPRNCGISHSHLFSSHERGIYVQTGVLKLADKLRQEELTNLHFCDSIKFPPRLYSTPISPSALKGVVEFRNTYKIRGQEHFQHGHILIDCSISGELTFAGNSAFTKFESQDFSTNPFGDLIVDKVDDDGIAADYQRIDSLRLDETNVRLVRVNAGRPDFIADTKPSRSLRGTHMELVIDGKLRWKDNVAKNKFYFPGMSPEELSRTTC